MKVTINESIGTVTVEHAGETLVCHRERLSEENREYGLLHGIKQRIVDSAAVERSEVLPDGSRRIVSADRRIAMQLSNMREIIDHLESGSTDWSVRPAGQGGEGGLLLRAMVRAGADPVKARESVAAMDRKQQNSALAHERLRDHVAALRAEAGRGVDVSGTLGALGI